MKRAALFALLVVLCPGSAMAQELFDFEKPAWGPRFRVTPFVGFAATAKRVERWTVTGNGGLASPSFDVELGSGPAAGLTAEMQVFERFAMAASGVLVSRGRTVERVVGDAELFEHEGSSFLFLKAAVVIRLREQTSEVQVHTLSGSIFVGPAMVREMPKDDPFSPSLLLEPLTHRGLTFGFDAEIPLPWNVMSFTAGMEDVVVWWNTAEFGRRNDAIFAANGVETVSFVETDPTHNLLFRAGLSLRFR